MKPTFKLFKYTYIQARLPRVNFLKVGERISLPLDSWFPQRGLRRAEFFGMLRPTVWQKFTDVSEKRTSSILGVEAKAKQATSNKQATDRIHGRFGGTYCLQFQG
jgi:hypothetical protein